jgi:very-short-patch-repair endonuclease
MAESELRLWEALRSRRFEEAKFRRQVPIGPFIADFACKAARLVIEVDGDAHLDPWQEAHDARRNAWLVRNGWQVIRFWTSDLANMPAVLEAIDLAMDARPSP